jgi:hypothetical protein
MFFRGLLLIGVLSVLCTNTFAKKINTKLNLKLLKNDTINKSNLKKTNAIESVINNRTMSIKIKKTDYCKPDLCLPDTKHIGCNNTQVSKTWK